MGALPPPLAFVVLLLAGWVNRQQQAVIESLLKTPSGGFPMAPLQLATPMSRDWGDGAVREPLNPVGETDEKMTGRAAA